MNINKLRQRPESVSSQTGRRNAAYSPSGAFNSPGLSTTNPEVPDFLIVNKLWTERFIFKRGGVFSAFLSWVFSHFFRL